MNNVSYDEKNLRKGIYHVHPYSGHEVPMEWRREATLFLPDVELTWMVEWPRASHPLKMTENKTAK